jgi:DNA-binding NarL/FixJ family response regulator
MDKSIKILIVDDSELMRINIFYQLQDNYNKSNILFAETIDEAWEILNKVKINVVLLDIYLPGKNGADLITDMLENGKLKHIPIIVITGTNKDSFVKAFFKEHVYSYLHKPIVRGELLQAIEGCTKY